MRYFAVKIVTKELTFKRMYALNIPISTLEEVIEKCVEPELGPIPASEYEYIHVEEISKDQYLGF